MLSVEDKKPVHDEHLFIITHQGMLKIISCFFLILMIFSLRALVQTNHLRA